MRAELRFVMHPDDETVVANELLNDPSIRLVDGPRWTLSHPESSRALDKIGDYCIVWSIDDLPELRADFIPTCGDWYCRSEHSTIQFLRSSLHDAVLTDGRFAVMTDGATAHAAANIERRFKALRRFLKKSYANSVVEWTNTQLPRAPATLSRSSNPSRPDSSLWVGPAALRWLQADNHRCIQTILGGPVQGAIRTPYGL
jgi:hypothetical protein